MSRNLLSLVIILSLLLAACSTAADTAPPTPTSIPTESSAASNADSSEDAQPATQNESSFAPITAAGEILLLSGTLLDQSGAPIPDALLEIWQTDAAGIYDHPGDPDTSDRDPGFQFFGVSTTDAEGNWFFRTILPGRYEPRPPHIHFKVKLGSQTLLTSQFYFSQTDHADLLVPIELEDGTWVGEFTVVVDAGSPGSLSLTPSQQEGPYYPVVDFFSFDNDLANPD